MRAPCRLHFGLLHVPQPGLTQWPDGTTARPYGGLGLMIDDPHIRVTVSANRTSVFTGTLAVRARGFVEMMNVEQPLHVHADGPPEHTGFGVGTALGLSVASAVTEFQNPDAKLSVEELAAMTGRGQRSRIGVHGFAHGGFLVDRGHGSGPVESIPFPADWRVITFRLDSPPGWFGDRERRAFENSRSIVDAWTTTRRLTTLMDKTIVPSLKTGDFEPFAAALTEYNRVANDHFEEVQGGCYSSGDIAIVLNDLATWKIAGYGQSSWGPTMFALCRDDYEVERTLFYLNLYAPKLSAITVSAADCGPKAS